jgi:hypothetical protein
MNSNGNFPITYYVRTVVTRYGESYEEIVRSSGGMIPKNEGNADYREYLNWLEEGNAPEEWNPEA